MIITVVFFLGEHDHQCKGLGGRLWDYQAHLWQHKCIHFLYQDKRMRGTSVHGQL